MPIVFSNGVGRSIKTRGGFDRRTTPDRRKSSAEMRLRVGLWYRYHRATRSGEFDALPRSLHTRRKLEEALLPEMQKYEFAGRKTRLAAIPAGVLNEAIDFVWLRPELGCNCAGEPMAVYTITALAEYIVRVFDVSVVDRRKVERRTV